MRKKTIKLSLLALLMLGSCGWFINSKMQYNGFSLFRSEAMVSEEEEAEETQTIRGAMEYYNSLKADLRTGKVDQDAVYKVYEQVNQSQSSRSKMGDWLKWEEMGPDDIGGRTRGIVIDKDNNNIIYAGGVSGGIWKSTNAGSTWTRVGGREIDNINVSCLAQSTSGALYYGTGEGGFTYGNADGNSGFNGFGVYKSTDRGKTFKLLASTKPANSTSPWTNVHRIYADPVDSNRIYAGNDGGIYLSDDAGATWKKVNTGSTYNKGKFILTSPDGQTVYVSLANNNPGGAYQLYRSKDRGANWEKLGAGTGTKLPSASSSYVLAMAPTNPKIIYLSSAAPDGSLDAVFRTEDGGDTWTMIGEGDFYFNPLASQGAYDHCIVVDPTNENRIVLGGLNLWEGKGINGKFQWQQLTNWSTDEFADGSSNPYHVHADQHNLTFDKSEKPVLYVGSDGGISKSVDFTYNSKPTFRHADYGYNTVQFYGIGVSAYNRDEVIGGTQDNGVLSVMDLGGGITQLNSDKIRGGDGGFSEISKINPNVYFGEYVNGDIYRSFNKGKNWNNFFDNNVPVKGPQRYPFISIFSLWESFNDATSIDSATFIDNENSYTAGQTISFKNSSGYLINYKLTSNLPAGTQLKIKDVVQSKLFVGAYNGIYFTKQALVSGITPEFFQLANLPGFVPHDIKHSADGNTVFVTGAEGFTGVVYRISGLSGKDFKYVNGKFNITDYGVTITKIFSKAGQIATGIAVDENDANHVLVTLGTYGSTDHIYRSKDALNANAAPVFSNISNNLPDFPLYDALISMSNPNDYLVAGEYGIWSSRNGGSTWKEENEGMERVPTFMLRQMKFDHNNWAKPVIYAATHGRGVFRTLSLVGIDNDKKEEAEKLNIGINVYPNPARDYTRINVELAKASDVKIAVIDIQGRTLVNQNYSRQLAGSNTYKIETADLKPGTYFVKVTAQGTEKTAKMLIIK